MSFIYEKITFLHDLLSQYAFAEGFTYYSFINEVSDACSEIDINFGSSSKKTLSDAGNFALFPVVFDYFNAIWEMGGKELVLDKGDGLVGFLESEIFDKARLLRDEIMLNKLTVLESAGEVSLPGGETYLIADFGLINRLVFNVASKLLHNKAYSLYERSAAFSLYKMLFNAELPATIESLYQKEQLVSMYIHARTYSDLSKKTISPSESLFNVLLESIESSSKNHNEEGPEKGVYGNRTLKFRVSGVDLIIPAELILQNKSLTMQEIGDWTM